MSFALFFETEATPEGKPQYLVFPAKPNEAVVFSRITNGGKKGLNVWKPTATVPTNATLTREPVAVVVTSADVLQYTTTGFPKGTATKALAAFPKAAEITADVASLGDVVTKVATADVSLNQYVLDGRRVRPVVFATTNTPTPSGIVTVAGAANPAPPIEIVVEDPETGETTVTVQATKPTQVMRMAVVPEIAVAKRYIGRKVSGVSDFDVLGYARSNHLNTLLYGPTGSAKTTVARAFAAKHNMPVFMVSGTVSLEASALFGRYIPDGEGGFVWQDGGVTELARYGGMLILDEVNFIPSKIATVLFSLLAETTRSLTLLDHKGETIMAHPDLMIVATMNPNYVGTQEMNQAFRNRFSVQIEWGYDEKVEKTLIPYKSLRDLAAQLRESEAKQELMTPIPTNALMDFVEISKGLGLDFAVANFLARFADDERKKVTLVMDAHRANIESDLSKVALPEVEKDEDDPVAAPDPLRTLADIDLSL
jgi:MoxR-like ATPase